MFQKRQLIPVLLLFLAVLACNTLFPSLPQNTEPDAGSKLVRKDGECSDKRFKDAELAAYKALVQSMDEAAKVVADKISEMETKYKKSLLNQNDIYQQALNNCKDTTCTTNAKAKNDATLLEKQRIHDDSIFFWQGQLKTANEAAQDTYNAAVEKARQQFCSQGYTATGQVSQAKFSGVICSLGLPFTLDVSSPYVNYKVKFTPSSPTKGTYTLEWEKEVTTLAGNGTYTVEGIETDSPRIAVSGKSTGVIPGGAATDGGSMIIDLVPLTTNECK
jgi:hypothetical protein